MKKAKKKAPAKKASKSTALAVRPKIRMNIADPNGMLEQQLTKHELTDVESTGGIGTVPIRFTKTERAIMARKVNRDDVSLLPDGTAYLPHIHYTRWFNEAFGVGEWAIVPAAKASKIENLVIVPYLFYVHGVPIARANGGAEYHEKNKRQNYDDVLESTVAYALRRHAKRLGMALELWDKRWLYQFMLAEGVQVKVKTRDGFGKQWRRKIDPPLPGEVGSDEQHVHIEQKIHVGELVPGDDGDSKEKISKEKVKRLVGIWRAAGRKDADVQFWLSKRYGYTATADIKRFDYNRIERELTARGDLKLPGDDE